MAVVINELTMTTVPDATSHGPEATVQPTGGVSVETLFDRLALSREREARLAVD